MIFDEIQVNKMELGSEYDLNLNELTLKEDNFFCFLEKHHYSYRLYDSGRSALRHLPFDRNGIVLLPEYICESVINCFEPSKIVFYKIREDLTIDTEDLTNKITEKVCMIYIVHYYGAVQPKSVMNAIKEIAGDRNILLVEDTTQSLFSEMELVGDFAVSSIRKWFPIPQGGVLYSGNVMKIPDAGNLEKSRDNERSGAMVMKNLFLRGMLDCNEEYREIFRVCEEKLDSSDHPLLISDFAKYLTGCFAIGKMRAKRRQNYECLSELLAGLNLVPVCSLKESSCPFVFPIRVRNRDKFREYLIQNRVYCAVHWPFDGVQSENRQNARSFSETFISLPVDQRYEPEHMRHLADIIYGYEGELLC